MNFQEDYEAVFSQVTASQETRRRILNMANTGKYVRRGGSVLRKILIAAAIISLTAVTASAAEIGSWLKLHFSQNDTPLSQSQVDYIEKNEKIIQETKASDGWTVELRSAMNDDTVGYIVLGVTAPEGVSLEPDKNSWVDTGNPRILTEPEGVNSAFSGYWEDDGDGKDNTRNYMLEVYPSSGDPFGPSAQWSIHIEKFVRDFGPDKPQEVLTDGVWDFTFHFTAGDEGVELIKTPVKATIDVITIEADYNALATAPAPEAPANPDIPMETVPVPTIHKEQATEVTITSFILEPLSVKVVCDADSFVDLTLDGKPTKIVMKDGSGITLMPGGFNMGTEYTMLQPASPVVLGEVDYVLFPDGTKLPMP